MDVTLFTTKCVSQKWVKVRNVSGYSPLLLSKPLVAPLPLKGETVLKGDACVHFLPLLVKKVRQSIQQRNI